MMNNGVYRNMNITVYKLYVMPHVYLYMTLLKEHQEETTFKEHENTFKEP